MQNLNIALIQTSLFWESCEDNLEMFDRKLEMIDADLIVLPEMFSTGFSMRPNELAQGMDGKTVNWLLSKSQEKITDIVGSVIIRENKKYFNRLIWAKSDGTFEVYDKKHLFRYVGEDLFYSSGENRIIVDCCGWRVCPFICYDLRFPIWIRNLKNDYDLALFIANWPKVRSDAWKTLLVARAIENQCYVVGVNRVGIDGNDIEYIGDSSIVSPTGDIISFASFDETIISNSISYDNLEKVRTEFPSWMDADIDLVSSTFGCLNTVKE